ncbi:hypothetical protein G15_3191 [Enterococcus avium]|uniref:hypothetical protein n=1 Tax=Enterococcus malodoratus TaxID=71451 RepID=UPI0008BB3CFF|nr:hypothetical protein [Enterococcus malodoratus]BBM19511.1 hypothetical protein G15_3191 [Enterococcus avium]SET68948.1 hypothetical protein SAMN04487821_11860 [Enterococcus malodoratus]
MDKETIQKIKEELVDYLFKWKKQIAAALMIIGILLLLTIINKLTPNNTAWLQGSWRNQSSDYSFKATNDHFDSWTIKCKGTLALKKAKIAVNSTKKRVVMTDDGNNIEYHAIRTGRKQLKLKIVKNGKSERTIELKKNE